jgi:hypothetical protein
MPRAQLPAIIGGDRMAAEALHNELGQPFPFLFDSDDRVAELCLGTRDFRRPAMLVVDRYGAIWGRFLASEEDGAVDTKEALKRLEFLEIQRPECDVPDSPLPSQMI